MTDTTLPTAIRNRLRDALRDCWSRLPAHWRPWLRDLRHRRWDRLRLRRRRYKLTVAYAKVARIKYNRPPGLSPNLIAYDLMLDDRVLLLTDRGMLWNWPEDAPVEPIIDDDARLERVREIQANKLDAEA